MKHLLSKPFKVFASLSLKKKIVVVILLIVLIFIILRITSGSSNKNNYATAKAAKSTIVETVSETGSIATSGSTSIYSPTNGVVEEVLVQNGDSVTTGQKLFTIKSTATEQEKAQALANYLAAKNVLDTANATLLSLQAAMFTAWDRHKTLAESDEYETSDGKPRYEQRGVAEYHIAEKNWLAAESNYKKQQSVITQAQTALGSAYLAYQATQNADIKATADGTITNLSTALGHTVSSNSPAAPALPLATIANLTTTEVLVSLSENDIAKVQEGQDAIVDVSAVQNKTYKGVVKRADSIGTTQLGVVRYNVYIEITQPDTKLRPGMNVDVVITTNKVEDALTVPNAAVKPYQGKRAVRVPDKKDGLKYIPVEIGIRGKDKTQILKGIQEGQAVITALSNEQIKRPGLFGN